MWLRRAFYRWLIPAAFLLPLWLIVGWGVFKAGGWAFLWVIFIAVPSVFLGQLVFALLVRARPSARYQRAASWVDVLALGGWNALTIAVGFYPQRWFWLLLIAAIVLGLALLPLLLGQLWGEARGSFLGADSASTDRGVHRAKPDAEVFVVQEGESESGPGEQR